jgi:hypothetical protein
MSMRLVAAANRPDLTGSSGSYSLLGQLCAPQAWAVGGDLRSGSQARPRLVSPRPGRGWAMGLRPAPKLHE